MYNKFRYISYFTQFIGLYNFTFIFMRDKQVSPLNYNQALVALNFFRKIQFKYFNLSTLNSISINLNYLNIQKIYNSKLQNSVLLLLGKFIYTLPTDLVYNSIYS